jgi:NADPH:quinone reductase-like Zn-dependent oxidoreductase
MSLYSFMEMPLPTEPAKEPFWVFIYGGSTAMGIASIQYAKLSGAKVITTASAANMDYVKALGADYILDYKKCDVAAEVLALTGGELRLGLDCHGGDESTNIMAETVKGPGSKIATLVYYQEDVLHSKTDAEIGIPLAYTTFGEDFFIIKNRKARTQDYWFANGFNLLTGRLLAEGKIKPPRIFLNQGGSGFEGVKVGMEYMQSGKVSGGKLVYEIEMMA